MDDARETVEADIEGQDPVDVAGVHHRDVDGVARRERSGRPEQSAGSLDIGSLIGTTSTIARSASNAGSICSRRWMAVYRWRITPVGPLRPCTTIWPAATASSSTRRAASLFGCGAPTRYIGMLESTRITPAIDPRGSRARSRRASCRSRGAGIVDDDRYAAWIAASRVAVSGLALAAAPSRRRRRTHSAVVSLSRRASRWIVLSSASSRRTCRRLVMPMRRR